MRKYKGKPYHMNSLLGFQSRFPGERSCWNYLVQMRWSDGFLCPHCKSNKGDLIKTKKIFECRQCRKQVSATAGTIFHKSRVPLRKWFWAIFLMATSKKGVSMLYLQRHLKIRSYRTVWLMGQKIRRAMKQRNDLYQASGTVEVDEIYIGGQQSHAKRMQDPNKTPFMVAVEENKNGGPRFVSFEELEEVYKEHVLPTLKKQVKKGSRIKTDGAGAYTQTKEYKHDRSVYTRNKEKTQQHLYWVNMLTSNLKRFLISTYHGVGRKHRNAYLEEFAYRFNRRYWPEQAFDRLLYACVTANPVTLPELKA